MVSNEITVKLNCSINEICKILENKKFNVAKKFILDDTYYIPKDKEIKISEIRERLKDAIILRSITLLDSNKKITKLTKKIKQMDNKGNILNQQSIDCEIFDNQEGIKFLNAIGYKNLINIKENDIEFEKEGFKILIKDVQNGDKLVEIETQDNDDLNTIEKIKQKVNELDLPIDKNDYFVKKAEIELKKIL